MLGSQLQGAISRGGAIAARASEIDVAGVGGRREPRYLGKRERRERCTTHGERQLICIDDDARVDDQAAAAAATVAAAFACMRSGGATG